MTLAKRLLAVLLLVPALAGAALAGAALAGAALASAANDDYREVALGAVPDNVRHTAASARPGSYITRVVRQLQRNDNLQYRFYASQVGRYWVIVVRDDGVLVEVYESPNPPRSSRD